MLNAALQSYVSDQTAKMQLAGNIIQGINDLSATDDSLGSQLTLAQGQVATLTQQLQAVNLDDAAERAAVAALTQQLQVAQAQLAALTAQVGNATPTVWDALQYKTWNVAAGSVADTGASGATRKTEYLAPVKPEAPAAVVATYGKCMERACPFPAGSNGLCRQHARWAQEMVSHYGLNEEVLSGELPELMTPGC